MFGNEHMCMLCHFHKFPWKLAVLTYLFRWQLYLNDKDVIHCTDRESRGEVKGSKGRKEMRDKDIKEMIPRWI